MVEQNVAQAQYKMSYTWKKGEVLSEHNGKIMESCKNMSRSKIMAVTKKGIIIFLKYSYLQKDSAERKRNPNWIQLQLLGGRINKKKT